MSHERMQVSLKHFPNWAETYFSLCNCLKFMLTWKKYGYVASWELYPKPEQVVAFCAIWCACQWTECYALSPHITSWLFGSEISFPDEVSLSHHCLQLTCLKWHSCFWKLTSCWGKVWLHKTSSLWILSP